MKHFVFMICHAILLGCVLSLPAGNKLNNKKTIEVTQTTQIPNKATIIKEINKKQVLISNNAQTEKPATKKRNIQEILGDKSKYIDDNVYHEKSKEDYSIQPLSSYSDNFGRDNSLLRPGKYEGSGKDYRYYNGEARRKRTLEYDGVFNKPEPLYEPESQLSSDDLKTMEFYMEQQRLYNDLPYGRWSDINNPIDAQESEENDSSFDDTQENFFDRLNGRRFRNWADIPRQNKYLLSRKSFLGNPKLRVSLYRRAVL